MNSTIERCARTFDVVKKAPKQWRVKYKGFNAVVADNKKDALKAFAEVPEKKLEKACVQADKVVETSLCFQSNRQWFASTFHFQAPWCAIHRMLYGLDMYELDVVKFDQLLQVPDGVSTKEYIQQKYGDEAVEKVILMAGLEEMS